MFWKHFQRIYCGHCSAVYVEQQTLNSLNCNNTDVSSQASTCRSLIIAATPWFWCMLVTMPLAIKDDPQCQTFMFYLCACVSVLFLVFCVSVFSRLPAPSFGSALPHLS